MIRSALGATMLAFALVGAASANDSVAEMGAGGLVISRSDVVSIESETLYLSMDEVTVDYVFRNNSDRPVEAIVAFPMPDIDTSPYAGVAIPETDDNFLGFTVEADGQAIAPQLQQRAWATGVDVTDMVLQAGLPLAPIGLYDGLDVTHVPNDMLSGLVAWGIVHAEADPQTGLFDGPVEPAWILKSTYWWKMVFPPKTETAVHHHYVPAVGGAAGLFMLGAGADGPVTPYYIEKYCTDDSFVEAARRRQKAAEAEGGFGFSEQWLAYVLSTGSNWAGPIRHFRLVVDKGSPDNLVSFCGEGVSKSGPTTFEMVKEDFWPERDLDILFLVARDQ